MSVRGSEANKRRAAVIVSNDTANETADRLGRGVVTVVPITANVSIGVGAISCAEEFNVTVVADRELCPDLDVFTDGLAASLEALVARPA